MAHKYRDPYSGKIKSSRHQNHYKEKRDLKNLMKIGADRWYPWPVVWSDYEWDRHRSRSIPTARAYPKRNWRGKRSKSLKTIGHRKNRRNNTELTNTTYNKNFDFWWELD